MLRKPDSMLKNNPNALPETMLNSDFTKKFKAGDLSDLKKQLWLPLITLDTLTALPEHPNLTELLENIATRLRELATGPMYDECVDFVKDADDAHSTYARGHVGENFLQISAVVNFYLGRYEEALKSLDILSYVYFINHHAETDFKCGHFSMLAGMACMRLNQPEKAAMYYNRYIDSRGGIRHLPEELLHVLSFLTATNSLEFHNYGLISELNFMQEEYPENTEIGMAVRAIAPRITEADITPTRAAPVAPLDAVKDLFSHLNIKPYHLNTANVHAAMQGLAALIAKSEAIKAAAKLEGSDMPELKYQYRRNLEDMASAIKGIDGEEFVKKMSLNDVHTIIQADDPFSNYKRAAEIITKYPDIIAAKIKTVDDFYNIIQYDRYPDPSFGEILLTTTTGKQHEHMLRVIAEKFDVFSMHPNAGVLRNREKIESEMNEVMKKSMQASSVKIKKTENSNIKMALSVFGQKRPAGSDDVWERIKPNRPR